MSSRHLIAPLALLLLAGCVARPLPQAGSLDAGFGETVKYDMAVQTIDPDPVYPVDGAQPGDRGDKGAAAVKRYRTDAVKEVQTQTTTQQAGSGGGPQ